MRVEGSTASVAAAAVASVVDAVGGMPLEAAGAVLLLVVVDAEAVVTLATFAWEEVEVTCPCEGRKTSILRLVPPLLLIVSMIDVKFQSGPVTRMLLTEIISSRFREGGEKLVVREYIYIIDTYGAHERQVDVDGKK